jgi:putative sugar O-methyltransferase
VDTDQRQALCRAAGAGELKRVRALHQQGVEPRAGEDAALRAAAAGGHLRVVKYLHEVGADLRAAADDALRQAAAGGHLTVVKYLQQSGVPLDGPAGAQALQQAAAGGHADVVKYLHEQGAIPSELTAEGRKALAAMADEVAASPPIYHPSAFWRQVGAGHTRMLEWTGERNFKRTINQNFFDFIPVGLDDPRMENARRLAGEGQDAATPAYRMESPDRDPRLWASWYPSYQLFTKDPPLQETLYLRLVRSLYEFVLARDPEGVLARLDEPLLGNPIRVWRGDRLVSQDLANSVWERNIIMAHHPAPGSAPILVAELGAGYGRLGHVFLASTGCRYFVFDIPPALYLSQWYLSSLFPEKTVFRFRRFDDFSEVATEVERADIAFFTPNQLEKLPPRSVDTFVNISSLHEMRREQVANFLDLMTRTTRDLIYLKEYDRYVNPYDEVVIERSHYALDDEWETALERPDVLNPGFFELVLRRRAPAAEGDRPARHGCILPEVDSGHGHPAGEDRD